MKTICILINGISLPYHVINFALAFAKKESCKIFALFLKGTSEPFSGYFYPSDLPTMENGSRDKESIREDEQIIADNMELVKKLVEEENIFYSATIKTNTSIDEVKKIVEDADLIFVDKDFNEMSLLSDNKITLKELMKKISVPIHIVKNEED